MRDCKVCGNPIESIRLEYVPDADMCIGCRKELDSKTTTFARYVADGKTGCGIPIIAKDVSLDSAKKNEVFWKRGTNRCTSG